jgi:hypothetical protein
MTGAKFQLPGRNRKPVCILNNKDTKDAKVLDTNFHELDEEFRLLPQGYSELKISNFKSQIEESIAGRNQMIASPESLRLRSPCPARFLTLRKRAGFARDNRTGILPAWGSE